MKFSDKELFIFSAVFIIVVGLIVTYFITNLNKAGYCGDGICLDHEIGNCSIDCDWCGDSYCQENEFCSSCPQDCGDCEADSYCGDGICNVGECDLGCTKDCSFIECENGICEPEGGENCITSPNDCKCEKDEMCDPKLKLCMKITCGNSICDEGETHQTCPNDCKQSYEVEEPNPDENYPLIFVHGHSVSESDSQYSLHAFAEFQDKLNEEGYYEDRGHILANDEKINFKKGELKYREKPASFRTTYYKGEYSSASDLVLNDDNYPISEYADRLNKIIDIVLYRTGKNKVNIVAHSMGGLVVRKHIKEYGTSKVNKVVLIGTPNHGIYGWVVGGLCENYIPFAPGRKTNSPEFEDMQYNSPFINNLNSGDETPGAIDYLTIAGNCDHNGEDYHDEVIRVGSVKLDGATNKIIKREECVAGTKTFHGYLINPSKTPEVYDYVVDFLRR